MRWLFLVLLPLLFCAGCGSGIDEAEWREEVRLHDGTIVEVWRRAYARSSNFPVSKRGADISQEFRYEPLGVYAKSTWKDEEKYLSYVSFEIFDGVPYLVGYRMDAREWCRTQPPDRYLARFLKWDGSKWVDVSQEEFPVDQAMMNLYERYFGQSREEDAKGLIKWEDNWSGQEYLTVKAWYERYHRTCQDYYREYYQ